MGETLQQSNNQTDRKAKLKQIAAVGIPAVIESILLVVITAIDTKMISGLGKAAVSAVSFTTQPKLIILAIFYAMGTAASVFVAQALGKKDRDEANAYFQAILVITIILSLILGILCAIFAGPIMKLCNHQDDTVGMSIDFFRIIMAFLVFNCVSIVLNASLRGIGKTRLTLVSSIAMGIVDVIVNYLLIEGHCGFPRLEIVGDALGTVFSMLAACIISIILLIRHSDFLTFKGMRHPKKDPEVLRNIRNKAGNIVFENLFTRIGFLLSSIIISGLSSDLTAVYSVTMILLNYSFSFGDGLQAAVVTLAGRSMGAEKYQDVKDYVHLCLLVGAALSVVLSAIYLFGARGFYGMYFEDEAAISQGISYTYVAAVLTFMQIIRIINVGAMRSMGEVKIPRRMATICVLVINPAVAYLLTAVFSFGVWGIWIASLTSQVCWLVMSTIKGRQCMNRLPLT